jgi:predicted alpha/beta superfamily hydrolase
MKTDFTFRFLMLMAVLVFPMNTALPQEPAIIDDTIFSKILDEPRNVKICLPDEYVQGSAVKYDVVYILDGETHLNDFLYIYKFARRENFIPPLILISIPNTYTGEGNMRDRDFLPEKSPDNPKAGGASNFIDFLKNELIPYIGTKYPASGDNSLFGHSLGGLFTLYVFLKEPGLFSTYYCSDPALPWNDSQIITMTEETLKHTNDLDKTLWIIGVKETYKNVGIAKLDSDLMAVAPRGLNWKVSVYPNETHMSVRLKGIYDGLKYAFDGYNSKKLVEFHPNNGSVLEGKPTAVFLNGSFPNVYYTIDGSEPDTSSEHAAQMIEITAPARVTVKWIGENKEYITWRLTLFILRRKMEDTTRL